MRAVLVFIGLLLALAVWGTAAPAAAATPASPAPSAFTDAADETDAADAADAPDSAAALAPGGQASPADPNVVRAAVPRNYPPLYRLDAQGQPTGFSVEVFQRIANAAGLQVRWVITEGWREAQAAVIDGQADLVPSLGMAETRSDHFDFTSAVDAFPLYIYTRAGSREIQTPEDLDGRRVARFEGSLARSALDELPGVIQVTYGTLQEALLDLLAGQVDAMAAPQPVMEAVARETDLARELRRIEPPLLEIKRGVAVRRGDAALLARLEPAVQQVVGSAQYQALYRKWYGPPAPSISPASVFWLMAALLAAAVLVMIVWRHMSLVGFNRRLRHTVAELETAQAELAQAKSKADDASLAKSRFVASMSHEIRGPLSGVLGMLDLALRAGDAGQARESVQQSRTAALHLLHVVNDILDLSKIESGKLELNPAPFDVRRMLDAVVAASQPTARSKGLELAATLAADVPPVLEGDDLRLRQVLLNLVGNAVKFTTQGRVDLAVALDAALDADSGSEPPEGQVRLRFTVRDTGIGIPPERLETIFDAFNAGEAQARFGGTGLGLSITRQMVELMGGQIQAASTPGAGSSFSFTALLGVARPEDLVREPLEPAQPDKPPRPAEIAPRRILLVEDEPINRMVATEFLKDRGHAVTPVQTGSEMLEALRNPGGGGFDLVLLDLSLPDLDGPELIRRVRKGEAGDPAIPLVALTAYALKEDRDRFMALGLDGYLTKPLDLLELDALLLRMQAG